MWLVRVHPAATFLNAERDIIFMIRCVLSALVCEEDVVVGEFGILHDVYCISKCAICLTGLEWSGQNQLRP